MSETTVNSDINSVRDRLHLIVALLLAALLLLLPLLFKIGPNSWKTCGVAATATAPVIAPKPELPAAAAPADSASAAALLAPAAELPAPAPAVATEAPPPAARVYFGLDRYALPGDIETTLADVLAYLKRNPAAKAELKGFHDRRGKADHNRELASRRATSVSDYLIAAGVAADRVVIAQPVETTGSGPHTEARRVEVSVLR